MLVECKECRLVFVLHNGMPWPRIRRRPYDERVINQRARDRRLVLEIRTRGWDAEQWASFCTGAWVNGSEGMLFHEDE